MTRVITTPNLFCSNLCITINGFDPDSCTIFIKKRRKHIQTFKGIIFKKNLVVLLLICKLLKRNRGFVDKGKGVERDQHKRKILQHRTVTLCITEGIVGFKERIQLRVS